MLGQLIAQKLPTSAKTKLQFCVVSGDWDYMLIRIIDIFDMEKQGREVEKPLEIIKSIESTLQMLKSKIACLEKEEARTATHIQKIFTSSIPLIKSKIVQSHHILEAQNLRNSLSSNMRRKEDQVKASRVKQNNDIARNKQQLAESRAFESMHVKEISRKNNEKIAEIKQKFIKENRKKSEAIKSEKMKSRRKIQEFHVIKKYQLRKMREAESEELERRIVRANRSMEELIQKEALAASNAHNNQLILAKIKKMVNHLYKIQEHRFVEIVEKFGLEKESLIDDATVEKILTEIEAMIEEGSQAKSIGFQQSSIHRQSSTNGSSAKAGDQDHAKKNKKMRELEDCRSGEENDPRSQKGRGKDKDPHSGIASIYSIR